ARHLGAERAADEGEGRPGDVGGGGAPALPGERPVDRAAEQDRGQDDGGVHDDARQGPQHELTGDLAEVPPHLPEEAERHALYLTKTQVGCNNGNATSPITAATAMRSGLLIFQRNSTTRLTSATSALIGARRVESGSGIGGSSCPGGKASVTI